MDARRIVESALHNVKYPHPHPITEDPVWPKHSDNISGDPVITESDLEAVLVEVVEQIIDGVNDRINDLRVR